MTEESIRSPGAAWRTVLANRRDDIEAAGKSVLSAVESCKYDAASCFAIRLALEEALANAFKHGNKNDPAKNVILNVAVDDKRVSIDVEDEGQGFDPASVPDPRAEENLEIPSGRGIMLMRSYMTDVHFDPPGNRVRMRFERS